MGEPQIKLRCPRCGRTCWAKRESYEPKRARVAVIVCPRCLGSGFDSVSYEDWNGRDVPFREDGDSAPSAGGGGEHGEGRA